MADLPSTRVSLLVRIRDAQDADSWRQFVGVYAPLVYGYARRRGLQEADAEDVTQEVLRAVGAAAGRLAAIAGQGSFRRWLCTVTHHKIYDLRAQRLRQTQGSGASGMQKLLEEQPASQEEQTLWESDYERRLFTWAAEQVRPRVEAATWQAFWQTAVAGRAAKEVAAELKLNVAAVHLAKSRVMARLRKVIQAVEGEECPGTLRGPPR